MSEIAAPPARPMPLVRLKAALARHRHLAIAVSGGVDSLTLAHVAGSIEGLDLLVVHATGPAVPRQATERVRRHAVDAGWRLRVTDAGEYSDPDYRRNPVDRCFFCKNNLYARVRGLTDAPIASGTNLDDLGDYRPGLIAADEHGVVHPFVEAGIDKANVRRFASHFGLDDIAELPAQPCLASRVETGIAIDAADLAFIARVEADVAAIIGPGDIRCRLTAAGVRLEVPPDLLRGPGDVGRQLDDLLAARCAADHRFYAGRRDYSRGSAFLTESLTA